MTEIRQFINLATNVIPELAAQLGVHLPEPASESESFARIPEQCAYLDFCKNRDSCVCDSCFYYPYSRSPINVNNFELESFARIYEHCMTETELSHVWHLKNE